MTTSIIKIPDYSTVHILTVMFTYYHYSLLLVAVILWAEAAERIKLEANCDELQERPYIGSFYREITNPGFTRVAQNPIPQGQLL